MRAERRSLLHCRVKDAKLANAITKAVLPGKKPGDWVDIMGGTCGDSVMSASDPETRYDAIVPCLYRSLGSERVPGQGHVQAAWKNGTRPKHANACQCVSRAALCAKITVKHIGMMAGGTGLTPMLQAQGFDSCTEIAWSSSSTN